MTKEIDLMKLLSIYIHNAWLIILAAIVGCCVCFAYFSYTNVDTYTASATFLVSSKDALTIQTTSDVNLNELNTAQKLLNTYKVIMRSDTVLSAVNSELDGNYSLSFLSKSIALTAQDQTEVMKVTVTTTDPQLSLDICRGVMLNAPGELNRLIGGELKTVDEATCSFLPNSNSVMRNTILGGMIAALAVVAFFTLHFILGSKVTDEDDLTRNFTSPVLAAIPDMNRKGSRYGYKRYGRYGYSYSHYSRGKYGYKRAYSADDSLPGKEGKAVKAELTVKAAPAKNSKSKKPAKAAKAKDSIDKDQDNLPEDPARRHVISENTSAHIVEIYKMLRTNLRFVMTEEDKRALIVTSAMASEGKSTVTANLAIVAAQAGQRILIIDADMRKPMQSTQFNVRPRARQGLAEVLSGIASFDDAVVHEVRPNLDVLFAGTIPPTPSELLGSERMQELLAYVNTAYDLVLVDTPPVNVVTDCLTFVQGVAGVMFVTRQNISLLKEVRKAVEAIQFCDAKLLGFVIDDVRSGSRSYYRRRRYNKYYQSYNTGYYGHGYLDSGKKENGKPAAKSN